MNLYSKIKKKLNEAETVGDLLEEIDNAYSVGEIESIGRRFKNEIDRKTIEDEVNAIEEEYGDIYEIDEDSDEYASILDELKSCISSDFSGEEENINESEKLKEADYKIWSNHGQEEYYENMSREEMIEEIKANGWDKEEINGEPILNADDEALREYLTPQDIDLDYEDYENSILPMIEKQCYGDYLVLMGTAANWRGKGAACKPIKTSELENYFFPNYDATIQLYCNSNDDLYYTEANHDTPMGGTEMYLYSFKDENAYNNAEKDLQKAYEDEDWDMYYFCDWLNYTEAEELINTGKLTSVKRDPQYVGKTNESESLKESENIDEHLLKLVNMKKKLLTDESIDDETAYDMIEKIDNEMINSYDADEIDKAEKIIGLNESDTFNVANKIRDNVGEIIRKHWSTIYSDEWFDKNDLIISLPDDYGNQEVIIDFKNRKEPYYLANSNELKELKEDLKSLGLKGLHIKTKTIKPDWDDRKYTEVLSISYKDNNSINESGPYYIGPKEYCMITKNDEDSDLLSLYIYDNKYAEEVIPKNWSEDKIRKLAGKISNSEGPRGDRDFVKEVEQESLINNLAAQYLKAEKLINADEDSESYYTGVSIIKEIKNKVKKLGISWEDFNKIITNKRKYLRDLNESETESDIIDDIKMPDDHNLTIGDKIWVITYNNKKPKLHIGEVVSMAENGRFIGYHYYYGWNSLCTTNYGYMADLYKAVNNRDLSKDYLHESETEDYWDATELDRVGFMALLKFNNPEKHANPSMQYIITNDNNEVYRFAMTGEDERTKDIGAKLEFRRYINKNESEKLKESNYEGGYLTSDKFEDMTDQELLDYLAFVKEEWTYHTTKRQEELGNDIDLIHKILVDRGVLEDDNNPNSNTIYFDKDGNIVDENGKLLEKVYYDDNGNIVTEKV